VSERRRLRDEPVLVLSGMAVAWLSLCGGVTVVCMWARGEL
jgi:hypothetical protein